MPSQANFFLLELKAEISASELTEKMLNDHNILIKDLSSKLKSDRYVRIAVKDTADNDKFIEALKESLMV